MRINVEWDGGRGGYFVDMPGWNGGEVVTVDEVAALTAKITELGRDLAAAKMWIAASRKFALSHERFCPRWNEPDGDCNCGLHEFLSRPRPIVDELTAKAEALDALAENLRGFDWEHGVDTRYGQPEAWKLYLAIMDALERAK